MIPRGTICARYTPDIVCRGYMFMEVIFELFNGDHIRVIYEFLGLFHEPTTRLGCVQALL